MALEAELDKQGLLSADAPTAAALASTTPFACDVMPFEQWLQFIFLPKMYFLLDNDQPLPRAISIAPMAQHIWADNRRYRELVKLIETIDNLLSNQS